MLPRWGEFSEARAHVSLRQTLVAQRSFVARNLTRLNRLTIDWVLFGTTWAVHSCYECRRKHQSIRLGCQASRHCPWFCAPCRMPSKGCNHLIVIEATLPCLMKAILPWLEAKGWRFLVKVKFEARLGMFLPGAFGWLFNHQLHQYRYMIRPVSSTNSYIEPVRFKPGWSLWTSSFSCPVLQQWCGVKGCSGSRKFSRTRPCQFFEALIPEKSF